MEKDFRDNFAIVGFGMVTEREPGVTRVRPVKQESK